MKYCKECGRKIRENSKFCPYCGMPAGRENSETCGQDHETGMVKDKKSRLKPLMCIAAGAAAVCMMVGVGIFIAGKNGKSLDSSVQAISENSSDGSFEAYCQFVSDDNIAYAENTCYVDSQILITASENAEKKDIERTVQEYGGSIVGYISITNDYQIDFAESRTYEELLGIIDELEDNPDIESAGLNHAGRVSTDAIDYRKDPWMDDANAEDASGSEWSEDSPEGNNWWAEAVMMPSVWDMDIEFQPVKVGIYDTMFDTDNRDLKDAFKKLWNNPEDENGSCNVTKLYSDKNISEEEKEEIAHGSHVAGLICAEAADGSGITGISQNAYLYGFSFYADSDDTGNVSQWGDLFELEYSIAVMLNEGVKAINLSIGYNEMLVAAQNGAENALKDLETYSGAMETFLSKCLDAGYDFLIVKSSGNGLYNGN